MITIILLALLGVGLMLMSCFKTRRGPVFVGTLGLLLIMAVHTVYFGLIPSDFFYMAVWEYWTIQLVLVLGLGAFMMASRYESRLVSGFANHGALICFSMVGAVVSVMYRHFTGLFLGIEMMSIPLYILVATARQDANGSAGLSREAAMKYFVFGALGSALLALGLAFVYAATGALTLDLMHVMGMYGMVSPLLWMGMVLVSLALLIKCGVAPFHFWVPDVYVGAPMPYMAWMATGVKVVLFWVLVKWLGVVVSVFPNTIELWLGIAALSMLWGSVMSVMQDGLKRLMAYSSVTQGGFILLACLLPDVMGFVLAYLAVYAVFAFVVIWGLGVLERSGLVEQGAYGRKPLVVALIILGLLSAAGIPPLPGFFTKMMVLVMVIHQGYWGILAVAVLASVIGAYAYGRGIWGMLFRCRES